MMNKTYRYCNICQGGEYPHGPGLCDCRIAELPPQYYTVIDGWRADAISKIETIYGGKVKEDQLPTLERVVDAVANTYAEWVDRETNRPYMKARTAWTGEETDLFSPTERRMYRQMRTRIKEMEATATQEGTRNE